MTDLQDDLRRKLAEMSSEMGHPRVVRVDCISSAHARACHVIRFVKTDHDPFWHEGRVPTAKARKRADARRAALSGELSGTFDVEAWIESAPEAQPPRSVVVTKGPAGPSATPGDPASLRPSADALAELMGEVAGGTPPRLEGHANWVVRCRLCRAGGAYRVDRLEPVLDAVHAGLKETGRSAVTISELQALFNRWHAARDLAP